MRTLLLVIICWSVAANTIIGQSAGRSESGNAIYYADHLEGQPTSLGEIYHKNELTCSHRSYAKGTLLRVTRYDNNKSVVVRVNDNELHCGDCVVMLSKAGAAEIDLLKVGKTKVMVESVGYSNLNPQSAYRSQAQNAYSNDLTAKGGYTTNRSYSPNSTQLTAKGGAPAIAAGSPQRLPAGLDGYVIQLASYQDLSNAERQMANYQQEGIEHLYLKEDFNKNGVLLYRIVLGPFHAFSSAQNHLNDLKSRHLVDGVVVKIR
ncbi:MAG: SPOR domain-containing protein [Saprospiraceae bacterium]|jgi:rare lipoprotein A|nr:SPOR domain-containing protein [Saprospiraceae bacterium]